jgi:hypothetical protein
MRPAKQSRSLGVSGCLIVNGTFPCQKGVQNRTLTPEPRTFTKVSAILLQTPLVSCWHQRGAFENPFSGRDFHPAHLGTSRHKLSMQGCSIRGAQLRVQLEVLHTQNWVGA